MSAKTLTIGAGVERVKNFANSDNILPKFSLRSNKENEYPHTLCFCLLMRKLQSLKLLSELEEVNGESRGHPISIFYIFTAVKCSFFKYALYLINIFLYFVTFYNPYIYNFRTSKEPLKTASEWQLFSSPDRLMSSPTMQ